MGEARGRLAAAVVVASWSGLVAPVVVVEAARSRNYLCVSQDGYVSCPDGITYLVPHLAVAAATATTVLVLGVPLVTRGLDGSAKRVIAADLAVLAVLPLGTLGGVLASAALGGPPAAALVGAALLAPLVVVLLARRASWRGQPVLWLLLATAGTASVLWWDVLSVLTVPGAAVLVAGVTVACSSHESHQSHN